MTKPTFATALEAAAGGKLYQVVVDNEETGKALLTKGQLKKRVTLLPLSKIDSRTMSADRVDAAKKVAEKYGGQAYLALELISFDKAVTKAMQHVFGSTIICSSSDVAKAVAFDKSVKAKTITPEGGFVRSLRYPERRLKQQSWHGTESFSQAQHYPSVS